jgi:dihydroorotase
LREKADNDALIKALKDNTIDVICSGHLPQDDESKNVEFDQAEFGMINLQTCCSNLVTLSKSVGWESLIEKITTNPRRLLKLPVPVIDTGKDANLTLFDPEAVWRFESKDNFSKSKNSPWLGKEVKGRVVATFNNGQSWYAHG